MKVCYVTMSFPAATEPFACTDVRALRALGASVSVYALRPPRPERVPAWPQFFPSRARARATARLLAERGLADLVVSQGSVTATCRGLWVAVRSPKVLLGVVAWVLRRCWRHPEQLAKSLALLPRSLDIFTRIRDERPDVVHLFWGHYPTIVGYLVQHHLPGIVFSMFLGAYDLERRYAGSASVAQTADVVWTHAETNMGKLAALGVPRARRRMVHRGIDTTAFLEDGGVTKVPRRILTAARLSPEKAVHDVLAAFVRVVSSTPDATLVILGDGPERPRLEGLARSWGVADRIAFRGHVDHAAVRAEMEAAPVFLLMSRSVCERLPNAVKEAMASGCACVVTETPGIDELIHDGTSGFVVAQGDIAHAANQVSALLADVARASEVGEAARRHARAHFDVTVSMRRYYECWADLLRARDRFGGAVWYHTMHLAHHHE